MSTRSDDFFPGEDDDHIESGSRSWVPDADARESMKETGKRWGKRTLIVMGGLIVLGSIVGEEDDETPAAQPTPVVQQVVPTTAPAPTTTDTRPPRIIERTVEVPTMPQACIDYTQMVTEVTQAIYTYEQEIAPQSQILTDATQALVDQDPVALNDVKSRQVEIMNKTTGPLQTIIGAEVDIAQALSDCMDLQEE